MAKKFISNVRLTKKEVIDLNLNKLSERTDDLAVEIGFELVNDNEAKSFSKDDSVKLCVSLKISIVDRKSLMEESEEKASPLFTGLVKVEVTLRFVGDMEFENSIQEDYATEVFSLVYDDLRLILEANINRTSFRGLFLPADFRDVIPEAKIAD